VGVLKDSAKGQSFMNFTKDAAKTFTANKQAALAGIPHERRKPR
jgi:hypothetical protein